MLRMFASIQLNIKAYTQMTSALYLGHFLLRFDVCGFYPCKKFNIRYIDMTLDVYNRSHTLLMSVHIFSDVYLAMSIL